MFQAVIVPTLAGVVCASSLAAATDGVSDATIRPPTSAIIHLPRRVVIDPCLLCLVTTVADALCGVGHLPRAWCHGGCPPSAAVIDPSPGCHREAGSSPGGSARPSRVPTT